MAANRFATNLHGNSHKIVVVLVYAVLEWVLIILLLFNSLFYHMIKRFVRFFGLEPPCLLCSSVDQLFEPRRKDGYLEDLFCEAHARRIYKTNRKVVELESSRRHGCSSLRVGEKGDDGIQEEGCDVFNEEPQSVSDAGSFYLQGAEEDEQCGSDGKSCEVADRNDLQDGALMEWNCVAVVNGNALPVCEEDCMKFVKEDDVGGRETSVSCKSDAEKQDLTSGCVGKTGGKPNEESSSDVVPEFEQLRMELESERKARMDLAAELEAERNAAAIAANQTMAMINRLQEEKAAIKTEALQYQRMMEEQAEYDQEALQLLNELVIKREKEKQDLEKDLEMYKCRTFSHDAKSVGDDSEKLSIDLNREDENKVMNSTGVVLSSVDMVLDRVKNWNMLDGSLEEFEQERVSILGQLKELEEKLFNVCDDDNDDDDEEYDDVRPIEHFLDENADLCSAEVNLSTVEKSQPATMAAAAKKLLPFLEEDEMKTESDERVETEDKVVAVMKEMDHVYGRLQALEADREFLRHCINSINNGDKGIDLLGEILQHLRDLRNVDHSEVMVCNQ